MTDEMTPLLRTAETHMQSAVDLLVHAVGVDGGHRLAAQLLEDSFKAQAARCGETALLLGLLHT